MYTDNPVKYQTETKTAVFQGKNIVLENLTPVLSPEQRDKRKKEIERQLYGVFIKYRGTGVNAANDLNLGLPYAKLSLLAAPFLFGERELCYG